MFVVGCQFIICSKQLVECLFECGEGTTYVHAHAACSLLAECGAFVCGDAGFVYEKVFQLFGCEVQLAAVYKYKV